MSKDFQVPRVSFLYDRRKVAAKGKPAAVEIEVYYDRQRLRFSTGVLIYPHQWARDCVVAHEKEDVLNEMLQEQYDYVCSCINDSVKEGNFQMENLKGISLISDLTEVAHCTSELVIKTDVIEWMEAKLEKKTNLVSLTQRQHKQMIEAVRESKVFLSFNDFIPANVIKWDDYLHSKKNKKGEPLKQSTIYKYHKNLKIYVREAFKKGLISQNPYSPVRIPHGKSEVIKYLSDEEKKKIENLELVGVIEKVRDLFLFSCYTGLSFSDMIKIKKEDIIQENEKNYISDRRKKTNSRYKITIIPKALKILEKYDFNLNFISNQKSNKNLKKIASLAGIHKNLTMHMGRHTFATCALHHGIPIAVVSKMLAHSDIKTTQIYAKILQENVNDGFDHLKDI